MVSITLLSPFERMVSMILSNSALASRYGVVSSVGVLFFWIYYSAQIMLFGGAFTDNWQPKPTAIEIAIVIITGGKKTGDTTL